MIVNSTDHGATSLTPAVVIDNVDVLEEYVTDDSEKPDVEVEVTVATGVIEPGAQSTLAVHDHDFVEAVPKMMFHDVPTTTSVEPALVDAKPTVMVVAAKGTVLENEKTEIPRLALASAATMAIWSVEESEAPDSEMSVATTDDDANNLTETLNAASTPDKVTASLSVTTCAVDDAVSVVPLILKVNTVVVALTKETSADDEKPDTFANPELLTAPCALSKVT